jgi:hypothetical protein
MEFEEELTGIKDMKDECFEHTKKTIPYKCIWKESVIS